MTPELHGVPGGAGGEGADEAGRGGRAMSGDRWQRTRDLLTASLELATEERAAFVDRECADDPEMAGELRSLLDAYDRPGLMDRLAESVIAPIMSRARLELPGGLEWAGRVVAQYQLVERLGSGGMGVLYRARDTRLDRTVALKFLPPHLSVAPTAKQRFLLEARAAAALEHPNVCTIHEIGETADGQLYIAMPLYEGETLQRRIERGPLDVSDAVVIALQIARGLTAAHDAGIVHRDIKPSNVMLLPDGGVKILDFGVAKVGDVSLTAGDTRVGTVSYMSPEQARAEAVDRRADVWSLGVVTYEMLAGVRPFAGDNQEGVLFAILGTEPVPLSAHRDDVPDGLNAVIHRALRKRPSERQPSMSELAAELSVVTGVSLRPTADATVARRPLRPSFAGARSDGGETALPAAGERRQATVLHSVISGYDALVEQLFPDEIERLTARVREIAVDVVREQGGVVNQAIGDEIVSLFGVPAAHEDDFVRAARAGLALEERVRELQLPGLTGAVRVQSGAHTGSIVVRRLREGPRRFAVAGAPAQIASRLSQLAGTGTFLVSADVQRLIAPYFRTEARAATQVQPDAPPVTPYRVIAESGLGSRLEAAQRTGGGLTPYTGRGAELGALERQFELAATGEGRVAVVAGEAGAGKSRLIHELRGRVRTTSATPVHVLQGRCRPYGGAAPYLPFIEVLRGALGLWDDASREPDASDVAACVRETDASLDDFVPLYLHLLAIPSETHPVPRHLHGKYLQAAMLEALAALLTRLATRAPVLLLLEDWHWVDDASRDVLRHLSGIVPAFPLLVVVTCRPEAGGDVGGTPEARVHLGPLDAAASLAIMKSVWHVERVPDELARRVYQRTGGNPFFLEEVCQTLLEEGVVSVQHDAAVISAPVDQLHLPHTVQAVIRSRLDRLDPEAREVLCLASVIGREFGRRVLERALAGSAASSGAPSGAPAEPAGALERLRTSGLVQQTNVVPEPTYRFKHVLTQEVTYESLLEHRRATLHREVGRAIEAVYPDHLDEHVELLAHHFGRAGEWHAAVRYGVRAAERASALSQFPDALATLERVQQWVLQLPDNAERRDTLADVLLKQERLCETMGLRGRQQELINELVTLLAPHGSSARLAEAYLRQGDVHTLRKRFDAADRALSTSLRISRERGDAALERHALRSVGLLRWHQGRHAEALVANEQALAIDRGRADEVAVVGDLANIAILLRTMGDPERAIAHLEEALVMPALERDAFKRAFVLHNLANAYRMRGDLDRALDYLRQASENARVNRLVKQTSFHLTSIAHVYLQQGRTEDSLRTYEEAVDLGRKARNAEGLAQSLRILGEVLSQLGRDAQALPHLREGSALFAQLEDRGSELAVQRQTGTVLERVGELEEAAMTWDTVTSLSRLLGDRQSELQALEGLARVARRRGAPPDEVIARYETAAALAESLGERRREAVLRNTMGIVEWERGAFADALRQYETALDLFRALDGEARRGEGLILNSLGVTLHRLRRYDEALTTLEEGVSVHRRTGDRRLEAQALTALGDVYRELARPDAARYHYEESLALRSELGDQTGAAALRERIARVRAAPTTDTSQE